MKALLFNKKKNLSSIEEKLFSKFVYSYLLPEVGQLVTKTRIEVLTW